MTDQEKRLARGYIAEYGDAPRRAILLSMGFHASITAFLSGAVPYTPRHALEREAIRYREAVRAQFPDAPAPLKLA